jgi:hypothetical protein
MKKTKEIDSIKAKYPDQWILLGNPDFYHDTIMGGTLLFNDFDKKKVLEFAKKEIGNYDMIKIIFTGEASKSVRLNIFKIAETTV